MNSKLCSWTLQLYGNKYRKKRIEQKCNYLVNNVYVYDLREVYQINKDKENYFLNNDLKNRFNLITLYEKKYIIVVLMYVYMYICSKNLLWFVSIIF